MEILWSIPIVGIVVSLGLFVVSIPFAMSVLTWGLILYLADFVVQSTVFLYAFQAISWVVKDYKIVRSTISFMLQIIKLIWENGRKLYYRTNTKKDRPNLSNLKKVQ